VLKLFRDDLINPQNFVITLELVPARESFGRSTETLVAIAKDAFADGRVSAVSITDNPGGNPSLSPDVLGYEIFKLGMDVIVHLYKKVASFLEKRKKTWALKMCLEDPLKKTLLSCQSCGDCAIQHIAFLCPESGCPKHTRNGPCGGSRSGRCEVYPDQLCIWVRAYHRLKHANKDTAFMQDNVPPRRWELNKTSSWANFHLEKTNPS